MTFSKAFDLCAKDGTVTVPRSEQFTSHLSKSAHETLAHIYFIDYVSMTQNTSRFYFLQPTAASAVPGNIAKLCWSAVSVIFIFHFFVLLLIAYYEAPASLVSPKKSMGQDCGCFRGVIQIQDVGVSCLFSAQVLAAAKTAFIAKFVVTTGEVGHC